jgi:hypothetical protein
MTKNILCYRKTLGSDFPKSILAIHIRILKIISRLVMEGFSIDIGTKMSLIQTRGPGLSILIIYPFITNFNSEAWIENS